MIRRQISHGLVIHQSTTTTLLPLPVDHRRPQMSTWGLTNRNMILDFHRLATDQRSPIIIQVRIQIIWTENGNHLQILNHQNHHLHLNRLSHIRSIKIRTLGQHTVAHTADHNITINNPMNFGDCQMSSNGTMPISTTSIWAMARKSIQVIMLCSAIPAASMILAIRTTMITIKTTTVVYGRDDLDKMVNDRLFILLFDTSDVGFVILFILFNADCSVKTSEGFRLHKAVIRYVYNVPTVTECERMCHSETKFRCVTYSYKYSPHTRDNCLLCDRPISHLDFYTDLEPNRDYDIYSMADDPHMCNQPANSHGRHESNNARK